MDFRYIEQLLQRYWQCETSLEEEERLRRFFSESDLPQHLLQYKDLFVYQHLQQQVGLGQDFDARVLAAVEPSESAEPVVVKAKRLTLTSRLAPLLKAAAVVALVLWLGNVAQHSIYGEPKEMAVATDTIGKQITTPSVALSGDAAIAREKQILDSLQQAGNKVELKK